MKASSKIDCICASTHVTADALKALGHPVRLRIIEELATLDSCCCSQMCECFSQSQSTISQHLSVLRAAGIVDFKKHGNKSCFTLNRNALQNIQAALDELFSQADAESSK